jgi:predicted GH43/DUF377 family glycosyl hydrolase
VSALTVVTSVSAYVLGVLLDGLVLLTRLTMEALVGIRALYLQTAIRQRPEQRAKHDAAITRLRDARDRRWEPWRELPATRRFVVSAATLTTVAIFVWLSGSDPNAADPTPDQAVQTETDDPGPPEPAPTETADGFAARAAALRPGEWAAYASPVIVPGPLNSWADFKVGSPAVIVERERTWLVMTHDRYRMWYRGCHFIGDEYSCAIGHAESADGVTWSNSAEPVFRPADASTSGSLHGVTVLRVGSRYYMWYSVSPDWKAARYQSTINLAESEDGLAWTDAGVVMRSIDGNISAPIDPAALHDGKAFHLWYVDRTSEEKAQELVHAISSDGRHWRAAATSSLDTFDGSPGRLDVNLTNHGYRAVFAFQGGLQSGSNVLGTCVGADGNAWSQCGPWKGFPELQSGLVAANPSVARAKDGVWLWFVARSAQGVEEIRVAYRNGAL